jgi:transposase-like protein
VLGVVGRESGKVRLAVARHSTRAALQPTVEAWTRVGCTVDTDEWVAYDLLPDSGRERVKVKHSKPNPEYARDDDGDGVREVHCNTIEGIWTGLRNFLRTFRGVSKKYLSQYVAMFELAFDLKAVTDQFLHAFLTPTTKTGS